MSDKPPLSVPEAVAKMRKPSRKANWKPPELLAQEKVERVQNLQQAFAKTLNANPAFVEEIIAALGGLIVWLLAMNCITQAEALSQVADLKLQMRKGIKMQWNVAQRMAAQNRLDAMATEDNASGPDSPSNPN